MFYRTNVNSPSPFCRANSGMFICEIMSKVAYGYEIPLEMKEEKMDELRAQLAYELISEQKSNWLNSI